MKFHRLREELHRYWDEVVMRSRDVKDTLRGRRDPLVPPRRLMFDGPRDPALFRQSGQEFFRFYIDLCGLRPDERILDMGSGIGRKTVPLVDFLDANGRYVGLDINRVGISWCSRNITQRWPNFEFQHIDVHNRRYNPKGQTLDTDLHFPFDDESFDFVVMASLFTHMFPGGVRRYLHETARVLKRTRGRCLISYFLLNDDSEAGIDSGRSVFRFPIRREDHAIEKEHRPEDAVAYDEAYVGELYDRAGLEITAVHRGQWAGNSSNLSFQDLIIARHKRPDAS